MSTSDDDLGNFPTPYEFYVRPTRAEQEAMCRQAAEACYGFIAGLVGDAKARDIFRELGKQEGRGRPRDAGLRSAELLHWFDSLAAGNPRPSDNMIARSLHTFFRDYYGNSPEAIVVAYHRARAERDGRKAKTP